MARSGQKKRSEIKTQANFSTPAAMPDMAGLALYRLVEHTAARLFEVAPGDLQSPTRREAPVAFARQIAMYMAHVVCGLSLTRIGELSGRDRTTAAHACHLVEDRRDDPALDRSLNFLEIVLRSWIADMPVGAPGRAVRA